MNLDVSITPANLVVINPDYEQAWPPGTTWNEDFTLRNVSRPSRNRMPYDLETGRGRGLPAVARFLDDQAVPMDEGRSSWLYAIECELSGMNPESPITKGNWANLLHRGLWVANYAGSEDHYDTINGTNSGAEYIQAQPQGCGGWALHVLEESASEYKVEAIDPLGPYQLYHPSRQWWLFGPPVNSYRVPLMNDRGQWTGKFDERGAEAFDMFNRKSIWPVWGYGGYARIQKWRVRPLRPGEPILEPFFRI